jgi:hypothetical protein
MSTKKPDLAVALADAGGSRRKNAQAPNHDRIEPTAYQQPGRKGTRPITAHFPKNVRDQLKILAIQQNMTLHNLIAEAFNDLFAKYDLPEIAPRQGGRTEWMTSQRSRN